MNSFFLENTEERATLSRPLRLYALAAEGEPRRYILYDAVDADWADALFDRAEGDQLTRLWWDEIQDAPVYAVTVNVVCDGAYESAKKTLKSLPEIPEDEGEGPLWMELTVTPDSAGGADLYNNIVGAPQRVRIVSTLLGSNSPKVGKLAAVTTLTPDPADLIEKSLPTDVIDHVVVLDVGQGSSAALVSDAGDIVAYVDVGRGVLADAATFPHDMKALCLQAGPIVILTHWHYDHFQLANKDPRLANCTWITPFQTLGPGPQSAMAATLINNGSLLVWGGTGRLSVVGGHIQLERCTGPAGNQNRTGLAVWVEDQHGELPILVPGDAGYVDIPGLSPAGATRVTALAVAHHGGMAPGLPPTRPGKAPRLAFSYGPGNTYKHPLNASVKGLALGGWQFGAGRGWRADDARTEDMRPASSPDYGHVRLAWRCSSHRHVCSSTCGCTVEWRQ